MAAYLCETCHYLCKYFPQNISYLESGGCHDLTCDLCTWKVTHFRSIVQLNHSVQRRVPDRIETGKSLFFNPDLNLLLQKEANDEGTSLLLSRGKSPDRSFYQSLFLATHHNAKALKAKPVQCQKYDDVSHKPIKNQSYLDTLMCWCVTGIWIN